MFVFNKMQRLSLFNVKDYRTLNTRGLRLIDFQADDLLILYAILPFNVQKLEMTIVF